MEDSFLSPVKPNDVKPTIDFCNRLPDRTKYLRFFNPKGKAIEDGVERFINTNCETSMVTASAHRDETAGAARYLSKIVGTAGVIRPQDHDGDHPGRE